MNVISPLRGFRQAFDGGIEGECPRVVIADIAQRPRPQARVITVANEKGGVGKSTVAFHLAVALAARGLHVAAIDLDRRQQSLSRMLTVREGSARRLGVRLPQPRHLVLSQHSGAMLCQEIARIGWDCDVVVIDVPGQDSPIARRAMALADTLVTPINASFVDLDLIARFHPVDNRLLGPGCFAETVMDLRDARAEAGLAPLDWLVVPNRKRPEKSRNRTQVESALVRSAERFGFRLGEGLSETVAFRELVQLGLTHFDLGRIPQFAHRKPGALAELARLLGEIDTGVAVQRAEAVA